MTQNRRWQRHLIILALYLGVTLIMTWPLAKHLGNAIPGDGFDGWQNVWNLWWMRSAWLENQSSAYFSDILHVPTGVDLRYQTMAPFNGLMFLNIQTAFGLLQAYNAAVLFSFIFGAYGAYLLALYVIGRWRIDGDGRDISSGSQSIIQVGAFLAGLVFAFSPYHFAHLLGHLQLIVLQWIPFFILTLLRGLDRSEQRAVAGGRFGYVLRPADASSRKPNLLWRPWLADTLKAGLFLMFVGLCDWYYAMYCIFFTALVLLVRLVQRRLTWQGLGMVIAAGVFFGVTLSPLLLPMVFGVNQGENTFLVRDFGETLTLSADLLAFVTPQVFHPLWGQWALARSAAFTSTPSEFSVFAGFTVLFLAGIALLTIRKPTKERRAITTILPLGPGFWILAALVFALLAQGPVLHVNGRTDLLPDGGEIPLPYALLYNVVPFIKLSRSVSRMDVIVMLCLGIAAAFGLVGLTDWLSTKLPRSPGKLIAPAVSAIALLLILFEFLPVPYPLSAPDTPDWYQTLSDDPSNLAVLNLPANWERPGYLLFQTVHGKPIINGYITRDDPQTLRERAPVLNQFRFLGEDIHTGSFDLGEQGMQVLNDLLGVGWVVLDRYKMPGGPEREITEAMAREIFEPYGANPDYEDDRLTVFRVAEPAVRKPYMILDPGWAPRQVDSAGLFWRELSPENPSSLELVLPQAQPLMIELSAELPASGTLRLLTEDGSEFMTWQSQTTSTFRSDAILFPEGNTRIALQYEGPPGSRATIYAIKVVPG
ncbi:MAG: hypothetical protein U9R25_19225 [Chloroflexota bacterium]|nr:hypothetical protein [Chloroflexota bacterium]